MSQIFLQLFGNICKKSINFKQMFALRFQNIFHYFHFISIYENNTFFFIIRDNDCKIRFLFYFLYEVHNFLLKYYLKFHKNNVKTNATTKTRIMFKI